MRKAVHLLPVFTLAACASAPAETPFASTWTAAGFEDGVRGAPFASIAQREDYDAAAPEDLTGYLDAMSHGLHLYCDPANAFAEGAAGQNYLGVCPEESGEAFETAFAMGRRVFELRQANAGAEVTIADAQAELWEVKQREAIIETALSSSSTRRADRLEYVAELKNLAAERERLEAEIASMSSHYAEARNALTDRLRTLQGEPESVAAQTIQVSY